MCRNDRDVHISRERALDVDRSRLCESFNDSVNVSKPELVLERYQDDRSDVVVPKKPIYVSKSHIRTTLPLLEVLIRTEISLNKCPEVAYSFNKKECKVSHAFPYMSYLACAWCPYRIALVVNSNVVLFAVGRCISERSLPLSLRNMCIWRE